MKQINCVCYSFITALIIVALYLLIKKIRKINENLDNAEVNDQEKDNIFNSLISEDRGKYPIKIVNEGEKTDKELKQEKIIIEPQFYNPANQMIDAAYDVIQDGPKNPFIIEQPGNNEVSDDKQEIKDGYFIDVGEVDGTLRDLNQNYLCGSPKWPVGFDLNTDKEIEEKIKKGEYVRHSPYTGSGINKGQDYSFTCIPQKVNKFLYCRGNNACKHEKI